MLILNMLVKTEIVETVTSMHHGQKALITKNDWENNQSAKSSAAEYIKNAIRKREFGKRTSINPAIAIVITADSNINPINELGNPKTVDCQDNATLLHDTMALILQESSVFSSLASLKASIDKTMAANRLNDAETSIVRYALRTRRALAIRGSDIVIIVTESPSVCCLSRMKINTTQKHKEWFIDLLALR